MLFFVSYYYNLVENLLSYADSEKDLGVNVNMSFNFNEHLRFKSLKLVKNSVF